MRLKKKKPNTAEAAKEELEKLRSDLSSKDEEIKTLKENFQTRDQQLTEARAESLEFQKQLNEQIVDKHRWIDIGSRTAIQLQEAEKTAEALKIANAKLTEERDWWQKKHKEDNESLVLQVNRLLNERDSSTVLKEVVGERKKQDEKWGEQNHPDGTGGNPQLTNLAIASRNATKASALDGRLSWRHILQEEVCEAFAEKEFDKLRHELIQVGAVAVAWVEAIDRRLTKQTGEDSGKARE